MFNNFFPENRAVEETMWKYTVERGRPLTTVWRMRIACWIPKDTHTQLCNIHCFSTATMLARTCLNVNVKRTLTVLL